MSPHLVGTVERWAVIRLLDLSPYSILQTVLLLSDILHFQRTNLTGKLGHLKRIIIAITQLSWIMNLIDLHIISFI